MPAISLVVCVHLQRDLLERLIRESEGCYDELIVLHDIPDTQNVREVVEQADGHFFERPPVFLQEPHWPFAWGQASHDWILRLDADEFPSAQMKEWLREFRRAPDPEAEISGYTCIWPLWDGQREITKKWPAGHQFLFNKRRVRFFGMCEMAPIADGRLEPQNFILHHQPVGRKINSLSNILFRPQSRNGARFIAKCLLGKPTDLVCWRWQSDQWPLGWEQIRQRPLWTMVKRLAIFPLRTLRDQWRKEGKCILSAALNTPIHHALICIKYWQLRRRNNEVGRQ
ncbi:MAG: hypothetical protein ACLQSR_01550 [Limisphaerales bacterium]